MLRVVAIIVFGIYALAIIALVVAYFADPDGPGTDPSPEPPPARHDAQQADD